MTEYYYIPENNEPEMKKYRVIYADPPWHHGSKSAVNNSTGGQPKPLSDHDNTRSLKELKK